MTICPKQSTTGLLPHHLKETLACLFIFLKFFTTLAIFILYGKQRRDSMFIDTGAAGMVFQASRAGSTQNSDLNIL
jgi:hypothetical protein